METSSPQLKCLICSASDFKSQRAREFLGVEFQVHRCQSCSHVWASPMPTDEELDRYYSSNKALEGSGFDLENLKGRQDEFIENPMPSLIFLRDRFLKVVEDLPDTADFLDIGCNLATLNEIILKKKALRFHCIELNEKAAEYCRERGKLTAISSERLERKPFGEQRFDCISFFNVFEHLPRPEEFIGLIKERLKPGGRVIFSIPNTDMLNDRIMRKLKRLRGKDTYPSLDPPFHLYGYNKSNIRMLFERNGFEMLSYETYLQDYFPGTYDPQKPPIRNLNQLVGRMVASVLQIARDDMAVVAFRHS